LLRDFLTKGLPTKDNLLRRGVALSNSHARVTARGMNQLIIFSLGVIFTVAFGIFFIDDGEFQKQSQLMLASLLFNLVVLTLLKRISL